MSSFEANAEALVSHNTVGMEWAGAGAGLLCNVIQLEAGCDKWSGIPPMMREMESLSWGTGSDPA